MLFPWRNHEVSIIFWWHELEFYIDYDAEGGGKVLLNENDVETVVSLSLKSDSPKIEVSMKPGEDSLYEPHDKGTYEKIKAYVLEKYGFKVSSLYIAQTKDKCGLDKRLNYNLSKKDDPHVPECPKEKEDAIMDAFRHFGLIE